MELRKVTIHKTFQQKQTTLTSGTAEDSTSNFISYDSAVFYVLTLMQNVSLPLHSTQKKSIAI